MDPKPDFLREGYDATMTVDPAQLPERFRAAASPPLPQVGRVVHFYGRHLDPVGPYAAIVSRVETLSEVGSPQVVAIVGLTVFTNWVATPAVVYHDVPGVVLGAAHSHEYWWQWPTKV